MNRTVKFIKETFCFMVFEGENNLFNIFVNGNLSHFQELNDKQLETLTNYVTSLVNHFSNARKPDVFEKYIEGFAKGETIFIESNGAKWFGQSPDTIDTLLNVLENNTLDPCFEKYGNFYKDIGNGIVSFFGNFYNYSHVFNLISLNHSVNEKLIKLIRENKQTELYKNAKKELLEIV